MSNKRNPAKAAQRKMKNYQKRERQWGRLSKLYGSAKAKLTDAMKYNGIDLGIIEMLKAGVGWSRFSHLPKEQVEEMKERVANL